MILSGKQPLLEHSSQPANYESPIGYFNDVITPNDRFFVRWHHASIPEIDATSWRLKIDGDAIEQPFDLTLDQLKQDFDSVELVAVCQCAGNRRVFCDPQITTGVQWRNGAVGNARWKGARLKDVLARGRLKQEAIEIAFTPHSSLLDEPTPDFVKSLPIWKAIDNNTLIAYEMNGTPLPHWNGFPARIVVPGWTGTYWVKQVVNISALTQPSNSYWMNSEYRIPKNKFPDYFVSQESETTTPITEIDVNSIITNIDEGQQFNSDTSIEIRGVAWDFGYGIYRVEVSIDEGNIWHVAQLGTDLGRFSFRSWQFKFTPSSRGNVTIMSRATNEEGITQPEMWISNPGGYHNNIIQKIRINVV